MEAGMVTPAPALVRFSGIQKTYDGETLVVKNLDLDIRQGRVPHPARAVGLGQDDHADDAGRLRGCRPMARSPRRAGPSTNVPPHKRDIGMVFQNYALFPHMTVAENIAFPLSVRKHAARPRCERARRRGAATW